MSYPNFGCFAECLECPLCYPELFELMKEFPHLFPPPDSIDLFPPFNPDDFDEKGGIDYTPAPEDEKPEDFIPDIFGGRPGGFHGPDGVDLSEGSRETGVSLRWPF